jgi:serine/threonine-protein kinase RsbW
MLGGVAEPLAIDPELLDDLKTAVSEACNNVVLHAYDGEPGPMEVRLYVDPDLIRVTVEDHGVGIPAGALNGDRSSGIGVPVIRALTQDAQFTTADGGGTRVQMDFAIRRAGRELLLAPAAAGPDDASEPPEAGEIVVSLSPVTLLTGVLGRLARTLAATAHFSLDRFSDVYLVTDTLAGHAASTAAGSRIGARLVAQERRLELEVGPFRSGTGQLLSAPAAGPVGSPLALLSDQVSVEHADGGELVRVVVIDHRR